MTATRAKNRGEKNQGEKFDRRAGRQWFAAARKQIPIFF
jgi:hypothetical protein